MKVHDYKEFSREDLPPENSGDANIFLYRLRYGCREGGNRFYLVFARCASQNWRMDEYELEPGSGAVFRKFNARGLQGRVLVRAYHGVNEDLARTVVAMEPMMNNETALTSTDLDDLLLGVKINFNPSKTYQPQS